MASCAVVLVVFAVTLSEAAHATTASGASNVTGDTTRTQHDSTSPESHDRAGADWDDWFQPQRMASSLQLATTMMALGLIPAVLLMTTSYIRITIVLGLLRQAFGNQQILPAQVTTALAMFCTGLVMWPTWTTVYEQGVEPWVRGEEEVSVEQLWESGVSPVQDFMVRQIHEQENGADIHLFLRHAVSESEYPSDYHNVPLRALLPAFLLSELKTAFLIGFRIYLPFLVIDLVVASITTSMGMFMLPPATVALPLKLLLFVLVDGWSLLIDMLLMSFV